MIAVVDYQKGNLLSVERGLVAVGADARITSDAAEIARADAIVLPGVGAFADAVATMNELGQMDAIADRVRAGVPFLGICLGMQLMHEFGVEGASAAFPARGLGLLPGTVDLIPSRASISISRIATSSRQVKRILRIRRTASCFPARCRSANVHSVFSSIPRKARMRACASCATSPTWRRAKEIPKPCRFRTASFA